MIFFFKIEKKFRKIVSFRFFLPFHPSSAPEGFLRMSPGFIMSGGVQAIRSTCVPKLYYLGRAKVFSNVVTDFGCWTIQPVLLFQCKRSMLSTGTFKAH